MTLRAGGTGPAEQVRQTRQLPEQYRIAGYFRTDLIFVQRLRVEN